MAGWLTAWALELPYTAYLTRPGYLTVVPMVLAAAFPFAVIGHRIGVPGLAGQAWRTAWHTTPIGTALLASLLIPLGFNAFTAWKAMLPVLHPFAWDAQLSRLDLWLHGGSPARFTQWVPLALLDPLYTWGWIIGLLVGMTVLVWQPHHRALLAAALTWILGGTLVAILFSSAGPAFFTQVTSLPSPYNGLLATLEGTEAARIQAVLWRVYQNREIAIGTGISGFPSMHVAVVTIFVLAWPRGRWLWGPFAALILIGSVRLGWHYAVDGYAGIALAVGCWWLAGKMRRDSQLTFNNNAARWGAALRCRARCSRCQDGWGAHGSSPV